MSVRKRKPLDKYDNKTSLSEIFNKEVERALEDYPQLRGRFAFVNTGDNTKIYDIDPDASGFTSQKQLERHLDEMAANSKKLGPFSVKDPFFNNIDLITYIPLPNMKLFTTGPDGKEKEALAIFDHELGHIIIKGSAMSRDPCYRECAADAFSIIRHMQRYGTDTDIIDVLSARRGLDFILSGKSDHFTTLAVGELDRLKDKIDFEAMTPAKIEELSRRIALNHTPHPDILTATTMAFTPVRRALTEKAIMTPMGPMANYDAALRTLAEVTLENKDDYHVFKIGSAVLLGLMNDKVELRGVPPLKGEYWDQVRAELTEQLQNLKENHVLMDMPVVGGKKIPEKEKEMWKKSFTPKPPEPPAPPRNDQTALIVLPRLQQPTPKQPSPI